MTRIEEVNQLLGISDDLSVLKNTNIVFVYCPPKVGSTTLVSSIRLNACGKYTVIHLHNELMLKILYGIINVKVLDIIKYNKDLGKNVTVIDIYRSPVEQKMSNFFENIDTFHFNTPACDIHKFDLSVLIKRFNQVYPHLLLTDHFRNFYDVESPSVFDFENKFIFVEKDGVRYFKIRLKDSGDWSSVLFKIFGLKMYIINDYETSKKPTHSVYLRFKENYKLPANFLETLETDSSLMFYYSESERTEYLNTWRTNSTNEHFVAFSRDEYSFYTSLSIDNQHLSIIQSDHYLDLGCLCNACCMKRGKLLRRLMKGEKVEDKIIHSVAVEEYLKEKIKRLPVFVKVHRTKTKVSKKIEMY